MSEATLDVITASQMLRQAREAMGISQDEVAQELFLTPVYIRLIDSDEIDKIAKQAFVRGYLRSYAKMVQLDGDEVVARYEKSQGNTPQKIEIRGVTQEPVGSTNFTGPVFQTGVLGLVGLVIVIALVWFLSSSDEEPVVVTPRVIEEPVIDESRPAPTIEDESPDANELFEVANTNEAQAESTDQSLNGQPNDVNEVVTAPVDFTQTDIEAAEQRALRARDEARANEPELVSGKRIEVQREGGIVRVDAGGRDELRFSFTDECWIEIEDGQGEAIYGDLNRSGDQLIVTGIPPFEILFGKAPAVLMEYNGNPFDLAPHTTSVETAKVRVGN